MFMPRRLAQENESPVLSEQETGWAPAAVWTFQRRCKSLAPAWNQTMIPQMPAHGLVTIETELSQLTNNSIIYYKSAGKTVVRPVTKDSM